MRKVKWGKYKLSDIFESGNGDYDIQKKDLNGKGLYVVTAGVANNGILGKTDIKSKIFNNNTITVDMFGNTFYRNFKYKMVTHARVFSLTPKYSINEKSGIFISCMISKITKDYGYDNMCSFEKIRDKYIELPTMNKGMLNFDFMNTFISELEAYHISELEAYLNVTGLKDYKLSKKEETIVKKLLNGEINYKKYKIVDLFDVKNSGNILSSDITDNSGDTPYLGATSQNNGVISYISYDESLKEKGNCVFIGGKTFVVSYQEKDFYSNDSHNLSLYYKNKKRNKSTQLFFCSSIFKSLYNKYFWNNSISKAKIYDDYMMIPINDKNEIDYVLMTTIISAIQKLIIKDVVLYSESKIKMTKKVVKDL